MSEKKSFPLFYAIYFGVLFVAVIAVVVGLGWLRGYLAEYESAQPIHIAEQVFDMYFKSRDFELLVQKTDTSDRLEAPAAVAEYLHSQYDTAELTYNSVTSDDSDSVKYIVKTGDYKIASFTLKKSGEKTRRGFDYYEPDKFEIFYAADKNCTVFAPEMSDVFVNDIALSEKYLTERDIVLDSEKVPEGLAAVKYKKYRVTGLINDPTVRVSTDGLENDIEYVPETRTYTAGLPNDAALETEYSNFVLKAVEEYAKYMQSDSNWGAVKPYFDPSTDLYTSVRTVEQYFVIDHDGYRFEDEYVGQFYPYDENTFSCRVTVWHVLENHGQPDFRDKISMTVYLRRVGNKFLIFDWNVIKE